MPSHSSYAFAILGDQRAPWRATLEEAWCDALAAGLATVDEDDGERVWLTVPADILITHDRVVTQPRDRRPMHAPAGRALEGSRIERIIARRARAG